MGVIDREEYVHAAVAGDIVLPLGGVPVPVHLTHVSGLDDEQSRGDILGNWKVVGVDDASFAPASPQIATQSSWTWTKCGAKPCDRQSNADALTPLGISYKRDSGPMGFSPVLIIVRG